MLGNQVVALPRLHEQQVGVGVEATDEFASLVPHVRLERVPDPATEGVSRRCHLAPGTLLDGGQRDKCLMADHPGQSQAAVGWLTFVEVTAGEVGVVEDGHLLFEVVETLQRRGRQPGGDRDHDRDALGVAGGEAEAHLPSDRPPHHGMETIDPEVVEQPHLAVDDVVEGHRREGRAVGPAQSPGRGWRGR